MSHILLGIRLQSHYIFDVLNFLWDRIDTHMPSGFEFQVFSIFLTGGLNKAKGPSLPIVGVKDMRFMPFPKDNVRMKC